MKKYELEKEISYQDVDFTGNLKLSHLLSVLSELATVHALELNVWNHDMIENYGWVVAKMHIQVEKEIKYEDQVIFKTWPGQPSRAIYPRYYTVEDKKNKQRLISISSIWTLLDLKKRRIVMPSRVGIVFPDEIMLEEATSLPSEIICDDQLELIATREVRYSDIDTNQHVNNARYLEWICDVIDIEKFRKYYINDLTIAFKKEITFHQTIYFYAFQKEDSFVVFGANQDNSLHYFEVEGHWIKKEK